jgi:hypothetical protein
LQGKKCTIVMTLDLARTRKLFPDMLLVRILAARVDHDEQPVRQARDHQIVENAAVLIREQPVTLAADRQRSQIDRHQGFKRGSRRGNVARTGADRKLPHMRDIEESRCGSHVLMFADNPARIVERHCVAGERHHARARAAMKVVQKSRFGSGSGRNVHRRLSAGDAGVMRPFCISA